MASRIVSVCYRTKKTRNGEARPTMVAIKNGDNTVVHKLASEDDERDFAMGLFPVSYRDVQENEDVSLFIPRQCKWRKVEDEEDVLNLNEAYLRKVGTGKNSYTEILTHVPENFEGLRIGDQVVMALGAGDPLAAMLYAKGKKHGGVKVWRTSPAYLKAQRSKSDKENKDSDHFHLLEMFQRQVAPFYEVRQPDKALISVAVKLRLRMETQAQRIAAGNRLLEFVKNSIYLFEGEDEDVNALIEEKSKILMRDDPVYSALVKEEKIRDGELEEAVKSTAAWQIFEPIEGVGPRIAAGFLCIGDVRRFQVQPDYTGANTEEERQKRRNKAMQKGAAKMMAYCGLHTMSGADDSPDADFYRVFARHKTGEVGNWSTDLRQAFYQFGEQLNRKPNSLWGGKLLGYKQGFLDKHPKPIICDKKLTKLFRSLELFFRTKAGVCLQPKDCKVDSVKALQAWFDDSCSQMGDNIEKFSDEIVLWQQQIAKAQVEGKTVKLFTPGHILKMAKWRTLTRFCRWLFTQLVRVMGERIENQENAA